MARPVFLEQDGNDLILYVEFTDGTLPVYPGRPCQIYNSVERTVATGEVVAAYQ